MEQRATQQLARLGYAARGIVYLIIASFALLAAFGSGQNPTDSKGALETVLSQPFGAALLAIVTFGLLCFAGWRLIQAFWDADHHGKEPTGIARRIAFCGSALANAALGVWAVHILLGLRVGAQSQDESAKDWTAYLLSIPFGQSLVCIAGLIVAGTGIGIALKGWRAKFRYRLVSDAERWVVPLGRLGLTARGLVFVLIGGFLIMAAVDFDPQEAQGLAGALRKLREQPYGSSLLGFAAFGLLAFSVFQFALSRYREIDAPDVNAAAAELKSASMSALGQTKGSAKL